MKNIESISFHSVLITYNWLRLVHSKSEVLLTPALLCHKDTAQGTQEEIRELASATNQSTVLTELDQ